MRSARSRDVPVSVAYRISAVFGGGGCEVMLKVVRGDCPLVVVVVGDILYSGEISE